jgi:hypothetical protein
LSQRNPGHVSLSCSREDKIHSSVGAGGGNGGGCRGLQTRERTQGILVAAEAVCDTTHVNAAADIHSAFDHATDGPAPTAPAKRTSTPGWLAINPVDLFRAVNLSSQMNLHVPPMTIMFAVAAWLAFTLGASRWKLRQTDF